MNSSIGKRRPRTITTTTNATTNEYESSFESATTTTTTTTNSSKMTIRTMQQSLSLLLIVVMMNIILFTDNTRIKMINAFSVIPVVTASSKSSSSSSLSNSLQVPFLQNQISSLVSKSSSSKYYQNSNTILYFARTENPHPDATNDFGIPSSTTLPPLYGDGKCNKRTNTILPINGATVTLVGSGPGDPNLLTVSAYKLLTQAQPDKHIIIIDRLVSKEIINLIPNDVTIKIARKLPGCAELAQEEIYWWAYQGLNSGYHIIRLKIGDPFVFGRGSEEILQFRQFGIEPIVIPGVSAAFAAPLLGNIPVTHRGVANQVVMCTGYGRNGTSPDLIQYHKEQTVVFLMAVGRLQELCTKLQVLANYPANTPVAIVEKAGCYNQQRTIVGTLTTISSIAQQYNIQPPSTIVVGDVVNVLLDEDNNINISDTTTSDRQQQYVTGLIQNATSTISSSS